MSATGGDSPKERPLSSVNTRLLEMMPFQAPWWLRGAHRQTVAASYWFGDLPAYSAHPHQVVLDDGDIVVVHDDCPAAWQPGGPAALLMHGLNGSHQSPLLVRIADKLTRRGVRVFRWDQRGCGAGRGLARYPYHAGRSDDLAGVIRHVVRWCQSRPGALPPDRPRRGVHPFLNLLGVSLSGNILLKYLGEDPSRIPAEVVQAIAVNPPIDLNVSVQALRGTLTRWYARHFVDLMVRDVLQRRHLRPDAPMPENWARPRGLIEFDDWYTAPVSGFASAREYYNRCSAAQFMSQIQTPTTVITSSDDPMIPLTMFTANLDSWSPHLRLAVARGGGHVGYFARRGIDPDEFWLDWRIVELMTGTRLPQACGRAA